MSGFPIPISLTPDFSQVYGTQRQGETVSTVLFVCRQTVETVSRIPVSPVTPLKWGVNERRFA